MFTRTSVLVLTASLFLTGCSAASDEVTPSDSADTSFVSVQVTGDYGSEPVVVITPGDPVTELQVTDLIVGSGDALAAGAMLTADYVGYGAATGQMFDASWVRGEPATFPLAGVILGWQEGLVGMQVGGRRLLVIPAEFGYGDNPPPGSGIEPGETLIFVVDLVSFE
jgi:FKBP-type peptidyl-prolyl cis-trans isomerase